MDKFDRIQQLHRILRSHNNPVPMRELVDRMECRERTVIRAIDNLRYYCLAPLEYDRKRNGWHYTDTEEERFELPGLWLTAGELQSLSLFLNLLENIGPGLLNEELGPVQSEINNLLKVRGINPSAFRDHIKVLPMAHQPMLGTIFQQISEALLLGKQIQISYRSYKGAETNRTISPQTLVHYRENWYLDAWCHLREELRTFHISRITKIQPLETSKKQVNQKQLKEHFTTSYGIFAGIARHTAKLRFDAAIAREISCQQWHPEQTGEWDGDQYLLTIPYSDDRELIQDILRHSPHVYVEAPSTLRKKVQTKLQQGLERQLGRGLG